MDSGEDAKRLLAEMCLAEERAEARHAIADDVLRDVKAIRSATMGSVTNDELLLETVCGRKREYLQLVRKRFAALFHEDSTQL